jgi:hypothetical protein
VKLRRLVYDFPCKKCGHNYEDHIEGYRCATCFADSGYDATGICYEFVIDNLKYLESLLGEP